MRKVREVLRLRFECGCTQRQIATSCDIGNGSVSDYLRRAADAGLTWDKARELSEGELEGLLFKYVSRREPEQRAEVDFNWVHRELSRTGVTLQLLCEEYQQAARARGVRAYQYSQFCELYATWRKSLRISMRQVHRAGEKVFVDYSGKKPCIVDPETGEVHEVELFVAVLGASNYTFAEATLTQSLPDFVGSHVRAFEYFGRVPEIIVPDQLRSAVRGPDRYDPDINKTFLKFAEHYGLAVIPARPGKPKDKAKVEFGVRFAQRWVMARLRNRTFFSLAALNSAIAELVDILNSRPFQKLEGTRRSAFERIDRPAMTPLPSRRYEYSEWSKARANIDYHVDFDDRFYSVPCELRQEQVEVCASVNTVEIWHNSTRVALHRRSYGRKGMVNTNPEHRPKSHEDYGDWPPERMISWGASFGPHVEIVIQRTLAQYPRPEMGYRPALGILRCARKHGKERMDAACERALRAAGSSAPHRKQIEAILKRGLEKLAPECVATRPVTTVHENVRGAAYYDKEEHSEY